MKKTDSRDKSLTGSDPMRGEYDFSNAERGKYFLRAIEGTNVVVLESDVAEAFPDSASVNRALRLLIEIAHHQIGARVIAEQQAKYGPE